MTDLIKIKGLKGKQNKKKWAKNIDVSGLLEAIEKQNNQQIRQKFASELVVEEQGDIKRKPLNPDRFKSKGVSVPKTKYNNKVKKQSIFDEPMDDAWASTDQPINSKYRQPEVPAIIKPSNGHSYNPDSKGLNELIESVIDYEGAKVKKTKQIKKLEFKPQQVRHRNKNIRQQQLVNRQRKVNKQFAHQLHSHRKVARQIDQKNQQIETRINQKAEKQQKTHQQALSGKVRYGKKIGKTQYKFKEHIPAPQQVGRKISHVGSSDALVKDRFDSIYRRGIFEPRNIKVHANKTKHIKTKSRLRDE